MSAYLKSLPRIIFKKGPPLQLIYFVTSRCNSSCAHCFLRGKLNQERDVLTLEESEKIAKSMPYLLSLSLTGGEPFLRDDLPQIAGVFYANKGFGNLVITSNGLESERITAAAERILSACRGANVFIGLSFDGLEDTHDSIRGVKGGFARAKETFLKLKGLKSRYKNLSVGTCTTCSPRNQKELAGLYDFLLALGPDGIGINLMRGSDWKHYIDGIDIGCYRNFAFRKLRDWRGGLIGHSGIRYNRILCAKESIQYGLIAKTYSERRRLAPCYAGRLLAVMRENGDVYPCEMFGRALANIRDFGYDFTKLWSGKAAQEARAEIKRSGCFCTYECATTSNILFNPRYIPILLREMLRR